MNSNFTVGQTVWYEFKPVVVHKVHPERGVTGLDLGFGVLGGTFENDLLPDSPRVEEISKQFETLQARLKRPGVGEHLNWGTIMPKLVNLWKLSVLDTPNWMLAAWRFVNQVDEEIEIRKTVAVQGVRIFL